MGLRELMDSCGFDEVGECPTSALTVRDEVRDMCAAGRCQMYGANWACPPACGDVAYFQEQIDARQDCFVAQTHGPLEDSFDFEGMMELEHLHKKRVLALNELVRAAFPGALVLSAGACTLCGQGGCTYPDAPCRSPERRLTSMEAAGLVVTEVCEAAGIPYNHGPNTMAYTSCVVL